MSKKNKSILISSILLCIFSISFITSYAFFNYSKDTNQIVSTTGDIYMKLDSGSDTISLTTMFPETQEEADLETNNYIDFSVKGLNEYDNSIYYEIDVINEDLPSGYTEDNRIDPSSIMLELTDLDTNKVLTTIKYSRLKDNRIYVKTINDTTEVEHKYRLRMWINENILISDTSDDKTYCASSNCNDSTKQIYKDLFASIKVQVYGDFEEKSFYNVMGTLSSFISYKTKIKEIYFLNEEQSVIDSRYEVATIKYDITNTDKTVGTTELQNMNDYGKVLAWLESIDETYYKLYIASDGYTYLSTGNELFSTNSIFTTIDLIYVRTNFVTDMSNMFSWCGKLLNLDLSYFDTSNVTDMSSMFDNANYLMSLDISNFDTSNVINMSRMFAAIHGLTSLDVSNFDTSNVTDMSSMFGSLELTNLEISNFDTSKVINMSHMFGNCKALTTIDLSGFDTNEVTDLSSMFYNCSSLTNLDLSCFDISNVTKINQMFYYCTSLITIYVGNDWSTSSVTSSTYMFYKCTNLVGGAGTTYNSSYVDVTYAHVDEGDDNPGYLTFKS